MSDDAHRDDTVHALAGVAWEDGASRATVIAALAGQPHLHGLLQRHLPEGTYFAVSEVVAALPEEVARASGLVVASGPGPEQDAVVSETFDGITPEGLGAALRATAGDLAREMEEPPGWFGAVVRSAVLPGWGQWHNGQAEKAVAFVAISLTLGIASDAPGALSSAVRGKSRVSADARPFWLGLLAATYIASLLDAYDNAEGVKG
jgi:hypothetical protein